MAAVTAVFVSRDLFQSRRGWLFPSPFPISQLLSHRVLLVAACLSSSRRPRLLVPRLLRPCQTQLPGRRAVWGVPRSAPDLRPAAHGPAPVGLGAGQGSASFAAAGMRWCGLRLLLVLFCLVIAAAAEEDKTNILQAGKNYDNNIAHSDGGKTGQHDETNPNRGQHDEAKNDTDENNKKDKSIEGTMKTKDEATVNHLDKGVSTAKSSHVTDFSQDPLIKECDPLHRCVIENKKFIACLKVPGEDSLALSLLIDNKGVNPLDVGITTPEFVTSAEDTVHVKANDHNKTQVTIFNNGAPNMAIVLRVAEETCNISIHRAIARETSRVMPMRLTTTYMLVPVFVLIGAVVACIKLRRTGKQDGGPAYQKLDVAELPVSTGGKKEADQSDQWHDNWGDEWDYEAPLTPTRAMPNLSSKGLASRRSTKDGWKD